MTRVLAALLFAALAAGPWPVAADDPPKKLTADERKELEAKWRKLNDAGDDYQQDGKYPEAEKAWTEALAIARRLYPKDEFPDGHHNLAASLNNLGGLLHARGRYAEAEPLLRDSLAMLGRLFKGDHPHLAFGMGNLGVLLTDQGKHIEAESFFRDSLAMLRRLYKGDHPDVALTMSNLAVALTEQGRLAEAESFGRDALAMRRRLYKGDHADVAESLHSLAFTLQDQGKWTEAEALYREALRIRKALNKGDQPETTDTLNNLAMVLKTRGNLAEAEQLYRDALAMTRRLHGEVNPDVADVLGNLALLLDAQGKLEDAARLSREALEMRKRLFRGNHPRVALSLNNQASFLQDLGQLAEAERLCREALEMRTALFKGDHPAVVQSLSNLAGLRRALGKPADADPLLRQALEMNRRLIVSFARQKTEGEALTLLASLPVTRDVFLSNALQLKAEAATAYPELWTGKATVARIYEQRQQAARASAADPKAARMLAELADARRRRAELIFAPEVKDPATRQKREQDIKEFDRRIAELDAGLRPLLPALGRAEKLAAATPADLQKSLPTDAAVVDVIRYTFFEHEKDKPGKDGVKQTPCYLAFVATRDKIAWVDLGPAEPIEAAVNTWREAITGGKEIPAAVPARVRELVWEKVRKELPAGVRVVYVSPDVALCRVPWAALPGDRPGTVLLEDFAVATIPHGQFLLDQLLPADDRKNPPGGVLVVGGVDYKAVPGGGKSADRDLPLKPDAKGWPALPGAAAEAAGVAGTAAKRKLAVTPLGTEKATASAVLAELPKARYAHFATHGFFANPSFRSVLQLDPKHFEMTRRGERVGAGALSPLVMTGLVFAGANHPQTPGRGIVTGEALIDLDLSGLELAVLSACETGLGDVAGGEGTFGLQRAFHLAGTRNVVASLWKVPDQSTAALMALFYRNLWEKGLPPLEALREAQLQIYRNPDRIGALAEGFRGKFVEVPGAKDEAVQATAGGKAHPRLWAAFTLSGPGR